MHLNYLAFAVPVFLLFIWFEYLYMNKEQRKLHYSYNDTISNLSLGMADRLLNLFVTVAFTSTYYWLHAHWAMFQIPHGVLTWIILMLATDFVWYWYHRFGHEINCFWAIHIVHHQSEQYNYTVAVRLTLIQGCVRHLYWCLLPIIGFPPDMVALSVLIHGAYSFFTHTQMVGKLGWLEHILVTPSIHGVHHASNEKYLDKNYGDIFVFWDKMFGTFKEEDEEKPVYGLTKSIESNNFLWLHFHYFVEIAEACRRTKGFWAKLKIIFGRPADFDPTVRPDLEKRLLPAKREASDTNAFKYYTSLQVGFVATALFFFWLFIHHIDIYNRLFIASILLITLVNCGALLEQRKWVFITEYIRLALIITWGYFFFHNIAFYAFVLIATSIIWWIPRTEDWYLRKLYNYRE